MTNAAARVALEQLKLDLGKAHAAVASPLNRASLVETLRLVEDALASEPAAQDARHLLAIVRRAAATLKENPQHEPGANAEAALERVRQDVTRVFTELDAEIRARARAEGRTDE